ALADDAVVEGAIVVADVVQLLGQRHVQERGRGDLALGSRGQRRQAFDVVGLRRLPAQLRQGMVGPPVMRIKADAGLQLTLGAIDVAQEGQGGAEVEAEPRIVWIQAYRLSKSGCRTFMGVALDKDDPEGVEAERMLG